MDCDLPLSLIQLLSNTVVLYQTAPYLPISSLFALGASSKAFKSLIYYTPGVFRHLDLSQVKAAQSAIGAIDHGGEIWRNVQMDENVTEDDFYGGPLRGIFSNLRTKNILYHVQTLILDGLTVPTDLVTEIITHPSFNVRILSIRDVQQLNLRKLQQALLYAVRPGRPANTPTLRGLYIFGPKEAPTRSPIIQLNTCDQTYNRSRESQSAQIGSRWNTRSEDTLAEEMASKSDCWYERTGKIFPKPVAWDLEWAEVIQACRGIISFDSVACPGPRHSTEPVEKRSWYNEPEYHLPPRIATHALYGCSGCGKAPEGLAKIKPATPGRIPLMAPPPIHSSTIKSAQVPSHINNGCERMLVIRCMDCLRTRYCENCHKWWCEDCYKLNPGPNLAAQWAAMELESALGENAKVGVVRSCFECGFNCARCIEQTQFMCKLCGGGYCLTHNEGSSLTTCDWCQRTNGRRTREMY